MAEPRREWMRYQIQGYGRKYWDAVAETDDRARALAEAVKRARIGNVAYRVWDRVDRKEIWRGFGHGATVEEWKTTRPPGMIGENPKDYKGLGKRGRWSYVVLATKGWFGPFLSKESAMRLLARVRRRIYAKDPSPLYEGQGELVIGQVRRSPQGWEFALPGTQHVTYHYDKARDAILRAIRRRPRPNDRRTAMSITTRPAKYRVNPVLSKRMQALRPGTMRLGDAMKYGKALLDAGYVIRVWDGSGWEVVIHPNDSMATSSGKGASGGRHYLAGGAGMVKTWPITLIAYRGQQSLGWMTPSKIRTLLARPTVSANSSASETPTFFVMHVSVDGAGIHTKGITLKRKAIALAQRLQHKSDKRGNPFGYHYLVYREYKSGRSDVIYRTKSRPKASANWNGRKRALMNSPKVVANFRQAHRAIVGAFLAGQKKKFGTSQQQSGTRYVTDGQKLFVWGNLVAEKVPGGVRIRDAGWQTLLTKNVLNEILDQLGHSRISQMRHHWYIGSKEWPGEAVIPTGALANRRRSRATKNGGRFRLGDLVKVSEGSGLRSGATARVVKPFDWQKEQGAYKPVPRGYVYLSYQWGGHGGKVGELFTMPANRLRLLGADKNGRARRNAFAKTPYFQIKGKIHRWESGQPATLPKGKTLVTVYLPGVDATVFETWIAGGERHWKVVRLHRHHNPLTKRESADLLWQARGHVVMAKKSRAAGMDQSASYAAGRAQGKASAVRQYGPVVARRAAKKILERQVNVNPRQLLGKRAAQRAMKFA